MRLETEKKAMTLLESIVKMMMHRRFLDWMAMDAEEWHRGVSSDLHGFSRRAHSLSPSAFLAQNHLP
jgi:hypothetical protein